MVIQLRQAIEQGLILTAVMILVIILFAFCYWYFVKRNHQADRPGENREWPPPR